MVYVLTVTTNFGQISKYLTGTSGNTELISTGLVIGVLFIGMALLFKATAAPFHMWAPDVYEGAPTIVSTFFAVVPKIAILGLFIRLFMFSFYDLVGFWQQLPVFSSLTSMVLAALIALKQRKLKRFFAYSSVGHVGYLLVGFSTGTLEGIYAMMIYTIIYIVMTLNAWTFILSTELESKGRGTYFTDLGYLSRINPLLAITFTMTLLSMAGVPPLAGFCAKMYIFFAAMEGSMYFLAVTGVLTSVIGAFYYIRFIKIMYFEKMRSWTFFRQIGREKSLILGSTSIFIVVFFLYPTPLMLMAHKLALTVCL
jgi:proton-translocating NADH-quinone oxidoreductase chain N